MPPIQDQQRHDPLEALDELDELVDNLTPQRLDRCAVICGVLGMMVLMAMLLLAVGVIPAYEWRPR